MASRVLVVEGKDDRHVIKALLKARALWKEAPGDDRDAFVFLAPEPFDVLVVEAGGVEQAIDAGEILKRFERRVQLQSDVEQLALVLDADEDPLARWAAVRDCLRRLGCAQVPAQPPADGLVMTAESSRRTVAVWMMPDNRSDGRLEDFLASLVPQGDRLLPAVDVFLAGLPPVTECPRFDDIHRAKARIHAYLAIQKQPGAPLGLALTKKYLHAAHAGADAFVRWLTRAFTTATSDPPTATR